MYAVIEQDLFGHRSVYEAQNFDDAYNWLDGLSKAEENAQAAYPA